ncbi:MAG: methyltransferase domain-containing protein [Sphingomonadaceae bacterium]
MSLAENFAPVGGNIWSSLSVEERHAPYDKMATGYDLLVGNGLYNRIVWGCPTSTYAQGARAFLSQAPAGPIIDFGCGSCVFTADPYRSYLDRLTLFDRSIVMMERAAKRLPSGQFLQGDALTATFAEGAFAAGMGWGMLHVFGTGLPYLTALHRILAPGAPVMISSLVLTNRRIGNHMLKLLHRNGEAAAPETAEQVTQAFSHIFALETAELVGSMLFLRGKKVAA